MAGEFDDLVDQQEFDEAMKRVTESEFGDLIPVQEPGFFDKGVVAGQGATKGAVQGAFTAAGAVAGMEAGVAAGALTGPAAPVASPVLGVAGAVVGGITGYMAGDAATDGLAKVYIPGSNFPMVFENINAVPEKLRPWAVMGETVGSSVPFATAPYILGSTGVKFSDNLVGRFLNSTVDAAKAHPYTFALVEAQMAVGSGIGAGVAETLDPGGSNTRMFGEIAGGTLNPMAMATKSARYATGIVKNALTNLSPAAQESKASQILLGIVEDFGENPKQVIAKLRAIDPILGDRPLSSGLKSGSEALIELENKFKQASTKFGKEQSDQGKDALEFMRLAVLHLNSTGDPQALKKAAEIQQLYYDNLLEGQRREAENAVIEAMAYFDPSKAASRSEFGVKAAAIVNESMDQVRRVERELWEAVPDQPAAVDNLIQAYGRISSKRLESEKLPAVVEKEIAAFAEARANAHVKGEPDTITSLKYLHTFRSRMLALSREAAAKNEWSDATAYGQLAEAALDDMTMGGDDAANAALTAARDWSRQLHERFSQSFAGDVIQKASEGGTRLPPELVMVRAFGSGKEAGALQFRQLQEAAHMAGNEYVSRMTNLQEQTLKSAASDLFRTGKVNGNALRTWRSKNKELLAQFPEIDKRLQNAQDAQKFFEDTEEGISATQREIARSTAFAKLVDNQDPAVVIGKAIEGNNPIADLNAVWKVARDSGDTKAIEGAEAALWSYIYDKSVKTNGDFSFSAYRQILEQPPTPSSPPLKNILTNAGMVGQQHMDRLFEVLSRAGEIERAMADRVPLDKIIADEGPLFDTVYRIMGTKLANVVPGQHNSLVIASSMSRAVRQVMDRMPKSKVKEVMLRAARDPEFAAFLLEKSSDPKRRLEWAQQMNAYLWQAGIGGWSREESEEGYSE